MTITPADIYRHAKVPVPTREKTLKVYIRADDIQPGVFENYADFLAATVVTAAMTKGVTRIELHFPNRQAIYLDCSDIKRDMAIGAGFWPTQAPPPEASVYNLWRLGARFESWRPMVTVPASLTEHVVSDGVSGDEPAPKEA